MGKLGRDLVRKDVVGTEGSLRNKGMSDGSGSSSSDAEIDFGVESILSKDSEELRGLSQ